MELLFLPYVSLPSYASWCNRPKNDRFRIQITNNKELNILCSSPNIIRVIKIREDKMGEACSTHRRDEKCIHFGRNGWDLLGYLRANGRILLKRILNKQILKIRTTLIWLRIWTSGGLLVWSFGFHKRQEIYFPLERLQNWRLRKNTVWSSYKLWNSSLFNFLQCFIIFGPECHLQSVLSSEWVTNFHSFVFVFLISKIKWFVLQGHLLLLATRRKQTYVWHT
jgi:hypothetical protein